MYILGQCLNVIWTSEYSEITGCKAFLKLSISKE